MRKFFADIKKYYKYVIYAGQTDLKAEVANSYLNWLWWIIEPLCFMFIYSLVFGIFFGSKEPHFNVFVYIGITMWDFFSHTLQASVKIIRTNKAIVSKVYLPKYMFILQKMYVNGFKLMIAFILLFIMMIVTGVTLTWNILWMFPILISMFLFTFAICTFLLHFGVYVDDLGNVVRIFLRMMFYLTGVFYSLQTRAAAAFGDRIAALIGHINPMASTITAMRDALLYGTMPDVKYLGLWSLAGLVVSIIGIKLIYDNENTYVKVI